MVGQLNLEWARRIVGALVGEGVCEFEVAPGSRSAPLVLALAEVAGIRVRVHLDERSAGFFALGYGRRARRPAACLTTSGTAVANLLPAVVEAAASDVPMILLTADRPPRLRGADANQTIDQVGIFGPRLRHEADLPLPSRAGLDAVAEAVAEAHARAVTAPGGPAHLNVPFDKPLQPESPESWRRGAQGFRVAGGRRGSPGVPEPRKRPARDLPVADPDRSVADVAAGAELVERRLAEAQRPVVLAGPSSCPDADGPALVEFSARLGIPLLADPLSGARFAGTAAERPSVLGAGDHFLRVPDALDHLAPDLILRTGRTPTSSVLESALKHWSAARQMVIDAGSQPKDHQGLATDYVRAPLGPVLERVGGSDTIRRAWTSASMRPAWTSAWRRCWEAVEAAAWEAVEEGLDDPANEGAYVAAALSALPAGATLFVSSSMPVRDLDAYGRPAALGVRVLGNRGASGIDGIVSSVLGCAAGGAEPVVALVGDLALCHDLNGLLAARDRDLNVAIVLIDNDGGGIFHMLPIREFEPAFTPCFVTPHGLDFRHAARLFGLPFSEADTPVALAEAVAAAIDRPGTEIIRVRTNAEDNRQRHEAVRKRVAAKVARALAGGPSQNAKKGRP